MTFWKCTQEDPLTVKIREVYSANVIRAPRSDLEPLIVLAKRADHIEKRGHMRYLISGPDPEFPPSTTSPAADLRLGRSANVDVRVGVELASKFLGGIGLSIPSARIQADIWKSAASFVFEVSDVKVRQVDVNHLGEALIGRRIDRKSPAAEIFFRGEDIYGYVVSRTLTSTNFSIQAFDKRGQAISAEIEALEKLVVNGDASASWQHEDGKAISFKGPDPAAFAFSAVPIQIRPDGTFSLGLELRGAAFLDETECGDIPESVLMHLPMIHDNGLLDIDEWRGDK